MTDPFIRAVHAILLRDLGVLAREVEAYPDKEALWRRAPGVTNPGGALARHLAGNVQHYIGAVLGNSGYVRDRDAEFSTPVDRATRLAEVEAARRAVDAVLPVRAGAGPAPRIVEANWTAQRRGSRMGGILAGAESGNHVRSVTGIFSFRAARSRRSS